MNLIAKHSRLLTRFFALSVSALFTSSLCAPASVAAQEPNRASLAFTITEKGVFTASVGMNRAPSRFCKVRLFALLSNTRGNGYGRGERTYLGVKSSRSRVVRFTARNLPQVYHVTSGTGTKSVAQLNIQANVTCGKRKFNSSVYARYLDCGRVRSGKVSPTNFLEILKTRIR